MSKIQLKKGSRLSTSQELDVAIALCEVLGVDADQDENLWAMLEMLDEPETIDLAIEKWG